MNDSDEPTHKSDFVPVKVRSFVVIILTAVLAYRLAMTPINLQFDFSAFLSLLLAIFSVFLSALFYFKATDTSNKFYDNTYKFSQDIGELLARIESGFGERLRHLDDSYSSMRDQLQHYPSPPATVNSKQEIKEEEKELHEKLKERDKMLEELATKAQLQDDEKKAFLDKLNAREKELAITQRELDLLQRQLRLSQRAKEVPTSLKDVPIMMQEYIREPVLKTIGSEYILEAPPQSAIRRFQKFSPSFNDKFLSDMREKGLLEEDNKLTSKGLRVLRALASGLMT